MKNRFVIAAIFGLLATSWAAAAMAIEGGWFETIDGLEREVDGAQVQVDALRQEAMERDEFLGPQLADADTARRATEKLRRDVTAQVASWDAARRRADQALWTHGPQERRSLHRALDASGLPATSDWQQKVRLLAEVDDGVEYAGSLLVRRSSLDIQRAQLEGIREKTKEERAWIIEQAANNGSQEDVDGELERTARLLERQLEMLDRNPSTRDFHRRKGGLFPPVSANPDHRFGPRNRENSFTAIRHTGETYFVDIGTEVRSVGFGTVVHADRVQGYGKMVIIDHDGDYHSIYAHLQNFEVQVGDEIGSRDLVGHSGESGSMEGPKFYFELRLQGRPVDPLEWFVSQ